jgi:hypothetical protein
MVHLAQFDGLHAGVSASCYECWCLLSVQGGGGSMLGVLRRPGFSASSGQWVRSDCNSDSETPSHVLLPDTVAAVDKRFVNQAQPRRSPVRGYCHIGTLAISLH